MYNHGNPGLFDDLLVEKHQTETTAKAKYGFNYIPGTTIAAGYGPYKNVALNLGMQGHSNYMGLVQYGNYFSSRGLLLSCLSRISVVTASKAGLKELLAKAHYKGRYYTASMDFWLGGHDKGQRVRGLNISYTQSVAKNTAVGITVGNVLDFNAHYVASDFWPTVRLAARTFFDNNVFAANVFVSTKAPNFPLLCQTAMVDLMYSRYLINTKRTKLKLISKMGHRSEPTVAFGVMYEDKDPEIQAKVILKKVKKSPLVIGNILWQLPWCPQFSIRSEIGVILQHNFPTQFTIGVLYYPDANDVSYVNYERHNNDNPEGFEHGDNDDDKNQQRGTYFESVYCKNVFLK